MKRAFLVEIETPVSDLVELTDSITEALHEADIDVRRVVSHRASPTPVPASGLQSDTAPNKTKTTE